MKLVRPGEGEKISDTTMIKAAREELAVVVFDYPPRRNGPDPHIHREHADCFWILDGELTFGVGPEVEERQVGEGRFVLVPPGLVHTFRNAGSEPARFLNIHAPGMRFDEYLRALRDGEDHDFFDSFDPPDDGGRPASDALVLEPGEGEEVALGPVSIVIKAGREHGGGALGFSVNTSVPHFRGTAPHLHERTVDGFYVLEGTMTLHLADRSEELGPGTYAMLPPGTVHSFANDADEPLRLLSIMAPGGFEDFFREAAGTIAPGEPPDTELLVRIASKYDFRPADPQAVT